MRSSNSYQLETIIPVPTGTKCTIQGTMQISLGLFSELTNPLLKNLQTVNIALKGLVVKLGIVIGVLPPQIFPIENAVNGCYTSTFGCLMDYGAISSICLTTINSQGYSFDEVIYDPPEFIDLSPIRQSVYVAVSRCRTLANFGVGKNVLLERNNKFMKPEVMQHLRKLLTHNKTVFLY